MKPILASDADLTKVRFPVWVLPKIDGVRALCQDGKLVGRSGKAFKNKLNTAFYSDPRFTGFDGEMVVARIWGDGICAETTSALSTIKGTVETRWCLFDHLPDECEIHGPYSDRYLTLVRRVSRLYDEDPTLRERLWVVPYTAAYSIEEVREIANFHVENGYEGSILRDPNGLYKHGRATANEANYLRLKEFMDAEILVTEVVEGRTNNNELKATPHGYSERSTHTGNMMPNGMVGSLRGTALQDVTAGGRVVITKGQLIEVAAGKMSHAERKKYFKDPDTIVGKIAKYQFFPVGIKDKPRFPTFQTLRAPEDL